MMMLLFSPCGFRNFTQKIIAHIFFSYEKKNLNFFFNFGSSYPYSLFHFKRGGIDPTPVLVCDCRPVFRKLCTNTTMQMQRIRQNYFLSTRGPPAPTFALVVKCVRFSNEIANDYLLSRTHLLEISK